LFQPFHFTDLPCIIVAFLLLAFSVVAKSILKNIYAGFMPQKASAFIAIPFFRMFTILASDKALTIPYNFRCIVHFDDKFAYAHVLRFAPLTN
jgi:hypothetical protein